MMEDHSHRQHTRCPECGGTIELVRPSEYGYGAWSLNEPAPTVDYKITYSRCDQGGHQVKVFWKAPFFSGYG